MFADRTQFLAACTHTLNLTRSYMGLLNESDLEKIIPCRIADHIIHNHDGRSGIRKIRDLCDPLSILSC